MHIHKSQRGLCVLHVNMSYRWLIKKEQQQKRRIFEKDHETENRQKNNIKYKANNIHKTLCDDLLLLDHKNI